MSVQFTVGIPTHNRREAVLLALASALEQTRPPGRVCVVADGCTDGTQEAVLALGDERVELLDRPKGFGYGYAHRNEVLERAGDGAVAWLADDDLWLPDHLERAGELLDAGAAGIVNSMACLVDKDGTLRPFGVHWRAPTYRDHFLGVENRTPSSAVTHMAAGAVAAGGWPERVERSGDWDLWKRIVGAGVRSEMVATPTVLFFAATQRDQAWQERVAQNEGFLARIRDPVRLAGLRAEMAFACSAEAHAMEELAQERDAARRREVAVIGAERDRALGDLDALRASTWWRLRRPFEPLLRTWRRVRPRA